MRIDFNAKTPEVPVSDRAKGSNGHAGAPGGAGLTDEAYLSGYARVQALEAELHRLPDSRQDKVATIAQQLRDGLYQVSPEQIAESMFAEMAGKASLIR